MYVHLGLDTDVRFNSIIAIIDLESTTVSKTTKDFLKTAQDKRFVINVSEDLPRSAVVCEVDERSVVFITHISSATLRKRINTQALG